MTDDQYSGPFKLTITRNEPLNDGTPCRERGFRGRIQCRSRQANTYGQKPHTFIKSPLMPRREHVEAWFHVLAGHLGAGASYQQALDAWGDFSVKWSIPK